MLLQRTPAVVHEQSATDSAGAEPTRHGWFHGPLAELDTLSRTHWAGLSSSSAIHAPFHRPEFVIPAQSVEDAAPPQLWLGYDVHGRLQLAATMETAPATPLRPFPILRAWQTPYSFVDGLLAGADPDSQLIAAWWKEIRGTGLHALEFPQLPLSSPLIARLQSTAAEHRAIVSLGATWTRPVLRRECAGPAALLGALSPRRQKSLRRGWRWLERSGPVDIAVHRGEDDVRSAARTLLRLESLGWKGAEGTALAARPVDRRFFLEVVSRLAPRGEIAFVELRVGNEPIASLAVLIHGRRGYAFKIGWDPAWERGCPGFQLMAQLVSLLPSDFPDLDSIDSCAGTDSFIAHVWPERQKLTSCLVAISRRAKLCTAVRDTLRAAAADISAP